MSEHRVIHGACPDALAEFPDGHFDAVVTDPPYELGFMGKAWDASGVAYSVALWSEVLRVLKPGGHLLAFGGTRTWHRMVVAIEDAGFEIRDELAWLYGSGFPKSLDVSKAIDKARYDGAEIRRVTAWIAARRVEAGVTNGAIDAAFGFNGMAGHWTTQGAQAAVPTIEQIPRLLDVLGVDLDDVPEDIARLIFELNGRKGQPGEAWFRREVIGTKKAVPGVAFSSEGPTELDLTAPATADAERWQGWGTALKPAHEPICMARKPLVGTVAANVLAHGTGALNIDGCRIGTGGNLQRPERRGKGDACNWASYEQPPGSYGTPDGLGRWPANVVLDPEAADLLDQQSGTSTSRIGQPRGAASGDGWGMTATGAEYDDHGGASRFFYVAKAAKHERPRLDDGTAHATVKPVALMRWLVRLITPPGGLVLDPFGGSGTTAEACIVEGFGCVLIEKDEAHVRLIEQRLAKPIAPSLFGAAS